jgi:ribosomal protein S5
MIFPNNGKGLVAGAAIRDILSLAGVRDVSSKVISGSKNKLNTARATIKALAHVAVPHTFGSERPAPAAENAEMKAPESK